MKKKSKKKEKKIETKQEKQTLEKIKLITLNLIKNTKLIIKDNKIIVFYIIGAVLNGILLRAFTIGNVFSIPPILADLLVSLIFASLYFLINKKYRILYLIIISLISVLVCLSNIVYYIYYSSFISVTFFSFVLANHDTGESNVVGDLIDPKIFIFLWLPVALLIANRKIKKNNKETKNIKEDKKLIFKTIYSWVLLLFIIFLATLKPVDFSRFYSQWNREYLVSKFGVYTYQLNDIVKSVEPKMATLFGKDKANREINNFYETREKTNKKNKYTNIFKRKNVIAVHAESMQQVLMGMKINGREVTPNLNKLTKTGLYFDNFYSQVSFGTSSDTEFTLATSLLPVSNGTVFINYSNRTYESLYKKLKEKGYYTFSMHANTGDFWNRNIMHQNLGYDKFYDKSSYKIDEQIGFGLSDRSFIKQSVEYIKDINKNHKHFYGTLITLSNHTPFEYDDLYGKFDVKLKKHGKEYPYISGTKLGDYIVSAHYADEQLGLLVKELEKQNILDNTIIVIYGDHDARISTSLWNKFYNYDYETDVIISQDNPNYKDLDYYWQEQNRRVPLIIWSNNEKFKENYSKKVSTAMGMYDLAPTLGNMLGVENKYALGTDIMNKKDNTVVFPNGNFVTNYVYYNDNKEEYKLLKNVPLSDDYISEKIKYTQKLIDISNDIIVYDYFNTDKNSNTYKEK